MKSFLLMYGKFLITEVRACDAEQAKAEGLRQHRAIPTLLNHHGYAPFEIEYMLNNCTAVEVRVS